MTHCLTSVTSTSGQTGSSSSFKNGQGQEHDSFAKCQCLERCFMCYNVWPLRPLLPIKSEVASNLIKIRARNLSLLPNVQVFEDLFFTRPCLTVITSTQRQIGRTCNLGKNAKTAQCLFTKKYNIHLLFIISFRNGRTPYKHAKKRNTETAQCLFTNTGLVFSSFTSNPIA